LAEFLGAEKIGIFAEEGFNAKQNSHPHTFESCMGYCWDERHLF
jgi:hypothetical protein